MCSSFADPALSNFCESDCDFYVPLKWGRKNKSA